MEEISSKNLVQLKIEQLKLLEEQSRLRKGLPFLHGWKWYKWAREFFESTNKVTLLVAGNQLSKSSSQIRKCLDWATNKEKWGILWRTQPRTFIYLYPSKDVALTEFEQKWVPEFMPAESYKQHPIYGWSFDKKRMCIHFNSGVSVFFKSYEQNALNLQTITAHAIFCDEELPVSLWDEIMFRLAATDGYFSMVFTATIGQDFWRKAMECIGTAEETLPDAHKISASAYDCLFYDDGSRSHWTQERIDRMKSQCKSHNEVLKRIYGRFVVDDALKYPTYDSTKHRVDCISVPSGWIVFGGVDIGSGGDSGHPAAICFVAVSPDFSSGRVIRAWRGDGLVTTASDVLMQYVKMKMELVRQNVNVIRAFYDWASKDFAIIAGRIGEPFEMAEKNHEIGEQVLNSLFKNDAMFIDRGDIHLDKLDVELSSLRQNQDKRKAKDDLADSFRYAVSKVPWNWPKITSTEQKVKINDSVGGVDLLLRDGKIRQEDLPWSESQDALDQEFAFWNDQYD